MRADVLDAITALDFIDGGISILLRVPGQAFANNVGVEELTVDVVVPPRERSETGKEFSKTVAILIQTFGYNIALPYLKRFQDRCAAEGVTVLPTPAPLEGAYHTHTASGRSIALHGTHIPDAEPQEGVMVRCRCRPGKPGELAQAFAIAELAALPPPRPLPRAATDVGLSHRAQKTPQ
ncbi:hypothetical protein DXG01_014379, partial [Tephrocybe rancida]